MKKILFAVITFNYIISYATPASAPLANSNLCAQLKTTLMQNHQKIDLAFKQLDVKTIGQLAIADHKIIRANLQCFPKTKSLINNSETNTNITSSTLTSQCKTIYASLKDNHEKIESALIQLDEKTIGQAIVENRNIVNSNLQCFPETAKAKKWFKK